MKIRKPSRDPVSGLRSTLLDKRFVPPVARTSPRTPGTLHLPHTVRIALNHT